jgi:hypothetical protein
MAVEAMPTPAAVKPLAKRDQLQRRLMTALIRSGCKQSSPARPSVRFGSIATVLPDLCWVRFTPDCVAKLRLRRIANRDSVD